MNPEEHLNLTLDLESALSFLSGRERYIIVMRYYPLTARPSSYAQIGKLLKVRRQSIQQLEANALRKLKKRMRLYKYGK